MVTIPLADCLTDRLVVIEYFSQAIQHYQMSLQYNKDNFEAHLELGKLLLWKVWTK